MGNPPLVSAVMPTYGRPRFLERAVKMFLEQDYPAKELIVLDDSPPELRPLLRHSSVRHVQLSERMTVGEKHDMGLSLAQGDFIAHWDDDDWYSPRRLTRQVESFEDGIGIVGIKLDYILSTRRGLFMKISYQASSSTKGWMGNGTIAARFDFHDGTAVFRREACEGTRYGTHSVGQKVEFLNALLEKGVRWKSIQNGGDFVYVRHGKNTWQFLEHAVLYPVDRPDFFPKEAFDFYTGE
jgi:glycosyltransferase involved in cell wall biosynthesis